MLPEVGAIIKLELIFLCLQSILWKDLICHLKAMHAQLFFNSLTVKVGALWWADTVVGCLSHPEGGKNLPKFPSVADWFVISNVTSAEKLSQAYKTIQLTQLCNCTYSNLALLFLEYLMNFFSWRFFYSLECTVYSWISCAAPGFCWRHIDDPDADAASRSGLSWEAVEQKPAKAILWINHL